MLYNYLKTTWRSLLRHKLFSLINVLGLATGMIAALLILEYVQHKWSFDGFHADKHNLYRVLNDRYQNGERIQRGMITYSMVGPTLARELPEVEAYTRMFPIGRTGFSVNEEIFTETDVYFADEHFFELFSFPVLAGSPETSLKEVNTLAISSSLAKKYFKTEIQEVDKVLDKVLSINGTSFTVKAVFEDVPENSHLQFDVLVSYQTLVAQAGEGAGNGFQWSDFYHYVRLADGVKAADLEDKLADFGIRHYKEGEVSGSVEKFSLQPLLEAHLYSDLEYEIAVTGNGKAVKALFIIALFILLIAWINYINLTTARSMERAREVGVRKVMGASRSQLIRQFMVESLIFNAFGLMIALMLLELFQPRYNTWLEADLSLFSLLQDPGMVILLGGIILAGMLFSGLYPAFVLSAYRPVSVLKGNFAHSGKGNLLRKGLVVFQFGCSVALIIGTLTIYGQLNYMQDQDLGLDIEQTLVLEGPYLTPWDSTFIERVNTFKTEVKRQPGVKAATASHRLPGQRLPRMFKLHSEHTPEGTNIMTSRINVDHDFMDVYGLSLIAGRSFRPTDHHPDYSALSNLIVNESLAKKLGYADPAAIAGKLIDIRGRDWNVVGVVADFHQRSLQYPMEPLVFLPAYSTSDFYSLKVSGANPEATLAGVREVYETLFPGNPFDYFFMDQRFEAQYRDDKRFGELFTLFAFLAICIACLGLFGLASYSTLQRTKEIGIRKVLGASTTQLFVLLSRQFILLIGIAYLIALPLAFLGIREWLAGYAYAMKISWTLLVLPGLLVLALAVLTISYQTLKSARANPVDSLKYE